MRGIHSSQDQLLVYFRFILSSRHILCESEECTRIAVEILWWSESSCTYGASHYCCFNLAWNVSFHIITYILDIGKSYITPLVLTATYLFLIEVIRDDPSSLYNLNPSNNSQVTFEPLRCSIKWRKLYVSWGLTVIHQP